MTKNLRKLAKNMTVLFKVIATVLLFPSFAFAKPMVLSSIKPLTLIVQEIAGDSANTDTLLPVTASPHDYPMKVSDYARLQKADVVLWIGPELESFLKKPISNLPVGKVVTAYDLAGLYWPEAITYEDHHHERDPHLWLDPRNAVVVARTLTIVLGKIDSANNSLYEANMQKFAIKMEDLDQKLSTNLKPVSNRGFAVYHEGYGHFVSHYGLHQLDYVTFTPEQRPGAKHVAVLQEKLAREGQCIFTEPYTDVQAVQTLAKDLKLQVGTLDALGTQEVTNYSQLLERLTDAFLACLTNGRN